jgi:hypothetical protein
MGLTQRLQEGFIVDRPECSSARAARGAHYRLDARQMTMSQSSGSMGNSE